jgi:hypothetical protein
MTLPNHDHFTWKLPSSCDGRWQDKATNAVSEAGARRPSALPDCDSAFPRGMTTTLMKFWPRHPEIMTLTLRNYLGPVMSQNHVSRNPYGLIGYRNK